MKLTLKRTFKGELYTIGHLYIDGEYFCDTLEDTDRELHQDMPLKYIKDRKIYGETAIPKGLYDVRLDIQSGTYSKKKEWYDFNKGFMPRIMNVPCWEGVLIHSGNSREDTLGCILVGENKEKGKVINSKVTFKNLYKILKDSEDKITLEIE